MNSVGKAGLFKPNLVAYLSSLAFFERGRICYHFKLLLPETLRSRVSRKYEGERRRVLTFYSVDWLGRRTVGGSGAATPPPLCHSPQWPP